MKIISKFKDYYDYIAGYDTDPRKVFIRKREEYPFWSAPKHDIFQSIKDASSHWDWTTEKEWEKLSKNEIFKGAVWFCDRFRRYVYHIPTDKFYYRFGEIPEDIVDNYYYKANWYNRRKKKDKKELNNHLEDVFDLDTLSRSRFWASSKKEYWERDLNKEYGQPIAFSMLDQHKTSKIVINGCLWDIQFNGIIPPSEAFTDLYNWIPFIEPEMPSSPVDMQRFEGKGFDKKTSFRNVK